MLWVLIAGSTGATTNINECPSNPEHRTLKLNTWMNATCVTLTGLKKCPLGEGLLSLHKKTHKWGYTLVFLYQQTIIKEVYQQSTSIKLWPSHLWCLTDFNWCHLRHQPSPWVQEIVSVWTMWKEQTSYTAGVLTYNSRKSTGERNLFH